MILCDDRDDAIPSFADYAAEYDREVGGVPVPRRLRGQHAARVRPAPPPPAGAGAGLGDVRVDRRRADPGGRHDARPGDAVRGRRGPRRAPGRVPPAHVRQHRAHRVHQERRASTPRSTTTCSAARCPPEGTLHCLTARPRHPRAGDVLPRDVTRQRRAPSGSPSTRSPRMLRMIAEVPPSMVLACARRNPRATVRGSSARAAHEAERRLPGEALALPRDPVDALEVDGQLLQPLVELRALQLGDRALGPGLRARAAPVGGALVVEPDDPVVDPRRGQPLAQAGVGHRRGGVR